MALQLVAGSIFFHLGRTGGYAIRSALQQAGLAKGEIGAFHATPGGLGFSEGVTSFAFVRHPLSWLRSLWYHKLVFGLDETDHPVLHHIPDVSPKVFLEYCIENFPKGFAYHYFEPYLSCDHIGRFENLKEDLQRILVSINELDANQKIDIPVENQSTHKVIKEFVAPQSVLDAYMATELHWAEGFGYKGILIDYIGEGNYVSPLAGGWSNRLYREILDPIKEQFASEQYAYASPHLLGCALRDGVPVERIIADRIEKYSYDGFLFFSPHLREKTKMPLRCYEHFMLATTLRDINVEGKKVLQVNCSSGFHAISAERLGAAEVTAIDPTYSNLLVEFSIPLLASRINYQQIGVNNIPEHWQDQFDIVIATQFHLATAEPSHQLSKLLPLLRREGTLLLSLDIIDDFEGIPLIFYPEYDFSPTGGLCYMTRSMLSQTLRQHEVCTVDWVADLKIGLDEPHRFGELPFPSQNPSAIHRQSVINRVLIKAQVS